MELGFETMTCVFKMGQTRPLFVNFLPFLTMTNIAQFDCKW